MSDRDGAKRRQRNLARYHRRVAERRERGLCVMRQAPARDLDWLHENAPGDYREFTGPHRERLAALVNHIRSLGMLLKSQVAYGHS